MDGVSAAASIWALLEATGTFLKLLNAIRNARREITELGKELTILYSLLCLLTSLQYHFDTTGDPSDAWNTATRTLGIENGPFAEYSSTLSQLQEKVAKYVSGSRMRRVMWPFVAGDVREMLARLERLKAAINLVVNVDQLYILHYLRYSFLTDEAKH